MDPIRNIYEKVHGGIRLDRDDGIALFESDDLFTIGELASLACRRKSGDAVYFVRNHHINPTNLCVNRCKFCAFSRSVGEEGVYEYSIDDIIDKLGASCTDTARPPFREIHIVGGLHPDRKFDYYLSLLQGIKSRFPDVHIKGFTAVEIDWFSKISGLSIEETLIELKGHGLDTMPGGGAEIFSDGIRRRLCAEKIDGKRWLHIHETAHRCGIRTNATMLYGHIEGYTDRIDHLIELRRLQDRTHGFLAFIPLSYHPKNTETGGRPVSGIDDLKTIAISRLMLDNFEHVKAYWIMLGEKVSQTALLFGADDIEGTVMEERITQSAGGEAGGYIDVETIRYIITAAGKVPHERDSFYNVIYRRGDV